MLVQFNAKMGLPPLLKALSSGPLIKFPITRINFIETKHIKIHDKLLPEIGLNMRFYNVNLNDINAGSSIIPSQIEIY